MNIQQNLYEVKSIWKKLLNQKYLCHSIRHHIHYQEKLKLNGRLKLKKNFLKNNLLIFDLRRKRLYLSLDLPTLLAERHIDTNKLMPKYVPADQSVTLNIPNEVIT